MPEYVCFKIYSEANNFSVLLHTVSLEWIEWRETTLIFLFPIDFLNSGKDGGANRKCFDNPIGA